MKSSCSLCLSKEKLDHWLENDLRRRIWAYIRICYSNGKEVVDYVTGMVPLLCVSVSADSPIGALSGITRGGGFQKIGAYVNLGAYYLVGAPIAFLLGFGLKLNAKRLWMGTLTRFVPNAVILAVVTVFTAWQKEATKARERIVEKSIEAHDGLV